MKISEIIKILNAQIYNLEILDEFDALNFEVNYAFSADLMSDTLFILNKLSDTSKVSQAMLITGLATTQSIKTAEIVDLPVVLLARGKIPARSVIDQANDAGIILLGTDHTVFNVSGILYEKGVKGLTKDG